MAGGWVVVVLNWLVYAEIAMFYGLFGWTTLFRLGYDIPFPFGTFAPAVFDVLSS